MGSQAYWVSVVSVCVGAASDWFNCFDERGRDGLSGAGTWTPVVDELTALRLHGDANAIKPGVCDHALEFRHGRGARDAPRVRLRIRGDGRREVTDRNHVRDREPSAGDEHAE